VNAANRTEGFCTLEGLPSDLLVRGDVNQNRAVEGDDVAVLVFKLTDWFKVYKEQEKVSVCVVCEDLQLWVVMVWLIQACVTSQALHCTVATTDTTHTLAGHCELHAAAGGAGAAA
jgi:hypothetical protein